MLPLLAPIFAQLVSLSLGARTEVRYVAPSAESYQEQTRPSAALTLDWKRSELTMSYQPDILLTPLNSSSRQFIVYHNAALHYSMRIRHTTISASETASYGKRDLEADAAGGSLLNTQTGASPSTGAATSPPSMTPSGTGGTPVGPTTPTGVGSGMGTTGTALGVTPALLRIVQLESATTTLSVLQRLSAVESIGVQADYTIADGVDAASRLVYPLFETARISGSWSDHVTAVDAISTNVSSQYGWSPAGSNAWVTGVTEAWSHAFEPRTSGSAGAGVSLTRNDLSGGPIEYSFYPTFSVGIVHGETLARGTLALLANVSLAPVIDPVTSVIDPRLGFFAGIDWSRRAFSAELSGTATVSVAGAGNQGAQDYLGAGIRAGYQFGSAFAMDGGFRSVWEAFQGQTVIAPTYVIFIGASFGGNVHVAGGAPQR